MRILVVEDDDNSRVLLERSLTARGYSVESAVNGRQALEKALATRPDIIISDILMPEMDGFEFCRRIKQDARLRNVPFIFYTATYTDQQEKDLAMALGASRFVVKPLNPDDFDVLIKEVVEDLIHNKLTAKGGTVSDEKLLDNMYAHSLARKLDKKVKELEQEKELLRESEYKYRRLVESLRDEYFFCTWDTKGNITYISPSIENVLGYTQEDFRRNLRKYLTDDAMNTRLDKHMQECLNGRHPSPFEIEVCHRDGSTRVLELSDVPVCNESGDVIAVESIARDITEKKKMERQLLQAHKMEAIGHLTGGIAHDFNNILSAIIGYGHLLNLKIGEGNPAKQFVDQILAASGKAANLTQSLLAFSRKQMISPRPCNINELVIKTGRLLGAIIGDDIKLTTVLHSSDDASDGDSILVMADYGQIEQTLINLATNARDSMPAGGNLTIKTGYMKINGQFIREHGFGKVGEYALITLTDTGAGIDDAAKQKIFDPFFTTKAEGQGTGLGLSMAYGVIKQHGGYIWTESDLRKGSAFHICLPLSISRIGTSTESQLPPSMSREGKATVLIAEDDDNLRTLIRTVLQKSGYRVIEALNGQEAVNKFMENQNDIQLIISDLMMPIKNGSEVAADIRQVRPDIKVIILSGYDDDIIRKKQLHKNNFTFLSKPVYPDVLLSKIREVFETA